MRIVAVGATRFGRRCFDVVTRVPGVSLVGIVTAAQRFRISHSPDVVTNVLYEDMRPLAATAGVPLVHMQRSMNEEGLLETVRGWKPDAFLVAGWYHMVPRRWRAVAPAYGLHASLLPDYSGGAPLVWSIINGEPRTGITLFQLDDGVDSGPIAGNEVEPILPNDTIATLYARIEERGLALLARVLPGLAAGTVTLIPQDEGARRVMPQRSPDDGRIDWSWEGSRIDRWVRAQTRPYPGAFTVWGSRRLIVWKADVVAGAAGHRPGAVMRDADGRFVVACGTDGIALVDVEYDGRVYSGAEMALLLGEGGQVFDAPDAATEPSR